MPPRPAGEQSRRSRACGARPSAPQPHLTCRLGRPLGNVPPARSGPQRGRWAPSMRGAMVASGDRPSPTEAAAETCRQRRLGEYEPRLTTFELTRVILAPARQLGQEPLGCFSNSHFAPQNRGSSAWENSQANPFRPGFAGHLPQRGRLPPSLGRCHAPRRDGGSLPQNSAGRSPEKFSCQARLRFQNSGTPFVEEFSLSPRVKFR